MALTHPFKEDHLSHPLSTPPGDCWCDVLGSVPAGSISSSSTFQILQDASHLWELLCPLVYLLGHFPSLQHVQGSAPTLPQESLKVDVSHGHMPVWASHVDIPLFVANLLNLWIHVILIGTKVVLSFHSFGSQSHATSWSFQFSVSQLTGYSLYTHLSWILSVDQHRCHAVNTQTLPWWRTTMQVTWSALSVAWWLGTGQFSSLL